jgi:hypothetical protein
MASRRGQGSAMAPLPESWSASAWFPPAWFPPAWLPPAWFPVTWFAVAACGRGGRTARRMVTEAPARHAAVIAAARQDSSRSIMWRASIPRRRARLAGLVNQVSPASSKR